ncbi:hypothetical protein EIP86_003052 [Pleurotus ostreatoroseus]|nr:hypothetical protein EIP86_003052 [Pleurotus ostreatoroseus]
MSRGVVGVGCDQYRFERMEGHPTTTRPTWNLASHGPLYQSLSENYKSVNSMTDKTSPRDGMHQDHGAGRNLVVCIDGTANQFSEDLNITNVIKIYDLVEKDATQLTFYTSGIGTYARSSQSSQWKRLKQTFCQALNQAVASDFESIVLDAYRWLSDNYEVGDKIYLFGFSRGAYQVRVLSAMIHRIGLIYKGNMKQIAFAYEIYTNLKDSPPDGPVDSLHARPAVSKDITSLPGSPTSVAASDQASNSVSSREGVTNIDHPQPTIGSLAEARSVDIGRVPSGRWARGYSVTGLKRTNIRPVPIRPAGLKSFRAPEALTSPALEKQHAQGDPISVTDTDILSDEKPTRLRSRDTTYAEGVTDRLPEAVFKDTFCHDVSIHFVGVWDTVSSVGLVRGQGHPDSTSGMEHVCYFRHALALDERRVKFLPEYVRGGASVSDKQEGGGIHPHTKEVWFAGSHSDV